MGLLGSAKKLTDTQKYYIDNFGKALLTKGVTFDVAESACKDVGHFLITQKDFAFNIASYDKFLEQLIKKGYPIDYIKRVAESVKLFFGFLNKELPNDTEIMKKIVKSASKEASVGTVVESAVENSAIMETGLLIYILSFLRWVKLLAGLKMLYFLLFGAMGLAGTAYVAKNPEVIKEATSIAKQTGQSLGNIVRITEVRKEVVTQQPTQVAQIGTTYNDSYLRDLNDEFKDMLSELKDRLTKVEAEETTTGTTTEEITNLITQLEQLRTELTSNLHYSPFEIRETNGTLLSSYTGGAFDLRTNLLVNGNTTVTGDTILNTLTASSAEITGDLIVDGNAEIKKDLTVDENAEVKGDLTVGGVLKLDTKDSNPSDGEEGDVYYNESDNAMYVYDGGSWRVVGPYEVGTVGGLEITGKRVSLLSTCTSGEILKYNGTTWACSVDTGGVGSTTFLGLTDTPSSYTANNLVKVNALGTALEFIDYSTWDTNASNDITTTGVLGDLLYNNGTSWVTLTAGTSGQYLRTNGAASPTWNTITGLPSGLTGQTLRNNGTNWIANDYLYNNGTSIGIGTTSPQFRLDVSGDGSVIARGTYGSGMVQPLTGSFTAMMWYPRKAAFRSGYSGSSNQWNDANIGNYSVAMGEGNVASGQASVAIGWENSASNLASIAIGQALTSSGSSSVALGYGGVASGDQSTAINYYTTATGQNALVANEYTTAQSRASTVLGRYNVISGDAGNWVTTDPLFVVGNGSGSGTRSNALTLLKDGSLGIGASVPNARFTVGGNNQFRIDSTGNITRINDIAYSFPASQGGASTLLMNNGSGTLTWGTAPSGLPAGTSGQTLRHNGSTWIANNFLYNSGTRIGIGTTAPDEELDVIGDIALNEYLYFRNGTSEYLRSDGSNFILSNDLLPSIDRTYNLGANNFRWENVYIGSSSLHIGTSSNESLIRYNSTTSTLSFKNTTDSLTGMQFLDADGGTPILNIDTTNERVGIGLSDPEKELHVVGDVKVDGKSALAVVDVNGIGVFASNLIAEDKLTVSNSTNMSAKGTVLTVNKQLGLDDAGAWSTGASGPQAIYHVANVYNGKMYIWGGMYGNTLDIYDFATNTWSTGLSGGDSRYYHSGTLYNGKIYFWGGISCDSGICNTLDIYDIATNSWSTGASYGTGIYQQSAVLYNGKMYVWGGDQLTGVGGVVNTMYVYDIATNTWATGVSGGAARRNHQAVVYNGKMYAWGGDDESSVLNTMDIYDFSTSTWSTGMTGGTARRDKFSMVTYNGSIYIWAGCTGISPCVGSSTMDVYNLSTGVWSTGIAGITTSNGHSTVLYDDKMYVYGGSPGIGASMYFYTFGNNQNILSLQENNQDTLTFKTGNTLETQGNALSIQRNSKDSYSTAGWSVGTAGGTAKAYHSTVVYNGKMYIWGGNFSPVGAIDIYDFSTNSWSTGTAGGTDRQNHTAVTYDGKMYVWGGYLGGRLNTMDIYDLVTGTWSTGTAGGTARDSHSAVVYNGKMYIWGGTNGGGDLNTMDVYDFVSGAWSVGTTGGTARSEHTAVIYGAKMYVWGGFGGGALNTMDIYDFATSTWSTGTTGGTARYYHSGVVYNNKMYIWGGYNGGVLNTMDTYDFATSTWSTGTAGGTGRSYVNAVVYNSKMYLWGGFISPSYYNILDIYDFGDSSNDDILVLRGNQDSGVLENETGDGQNNLFRFTTSGRAYSSSQGGWYSGGADLAEYYSSNEELQAGDVVSVDETETKDSAYVKKTNEANKKNVMGVVSTNPGFVAGAYTEGGYPIGLAGRVPVKVTTENGSIQKGDRLVAASKSGYAKKACGVKTCESDISIGIALESFNNSESGDSESVAEKIVEDKAIMEVKIEEAEKTLTTFEEIEKVEETKEKVESLTEVGVTENQGEGRVMMFVNLGYFIGKLDNSGELKTTPIAETNIVGSTENVEVSTTQNIVDISITDSKAILSVLNINAETSILEVIKEAAFKELTTFVKEVRFLAEVTFEKTVTYLGEVIFKNKVEFANDIKVNNKNIDIKAENLTIDARLVSKDKDMGGFAIIEKGQQEVTVKFDKNYPSKPVVTVTAENADLEYGIKDRSEKEFTIYITEEPDEDEKFTWIAIFIDGAGVSSDNDEVDTKENEVSIQPIDIGSTEPINAATIISENIPQTTEPALISVDTSNTAPVQD